MQRQAAHSSLAPKTPTGHMSRLGHPYPTQESVSATNILIMCDEYEQRPFAGSS